jgi:thymidine kinase
MNKGLSNLDLEHGWLQLFLGPMFSQKTSHLISELTKYADLGLSVIYINHKADDREVETRSEFFSCHSSNMTISPKIIPYKLDNLLEIEEDENFKKSKIIGIDESNFFNDIERVISWVDNYSKIVFVSGLDGDINRNFIGNTYKLIPYADKYEKLNAVCIECLKENDLMLKAAPFTHRKIFSESQVIVGGNNIYEPLCRKCFLQKKSIS